MLPFLPITDAAARWLLFERNHEHGMVHACRRTRWSYLFCFCPVHGADQFAALMRARMN